MSCYRFVDFRYKNDTVLSQSYLYNGDFRTWKDRRCIGTEPCLSNETIANPDEAGVTIVDMLDYRIYKSIHVLLIYSFYRHPEEIDDKYTDNANKLYVSTVEIAQIFT